MSIKAIKNIQIQSTTLDSDHHSSTMSVFPTMEIDPAAGHGTNSSFSNIRLRVVACYGKHSCQVMDYLSQRFNEYKGLTVTSPSFGVSVAPANFVSFLKADLSNKSLGEECDDPYDFLEESSPVSPFSTKPVVVNTVFQNRYSYEGDGKKLPPAMVMFDAPILELLDSKISKVLEQGSYAEIGGSPIHIDPVHFKLDNVNLKNSEQLSLYAYAYSLPGAEIQEDQIALTTGMSSVSSYNFVGTKTMWRSITLANPMIGIGYQDINQNYPETEVENAPDRQKLISYDTVGSSMVFYESLVELQRNLYSPNIDPILKRRNGIRKVVKKGNYFSDFWITKDSDENKRFMFAFDLESYLAEKSHFAYLYKRPISSRQIIDGTGLMTRETPSYIMNMSVKRIYIDPPSMLPINDLGTSGYSTELERTPSYPMKKIFNLRKMGNITIPEMNLDIPDHKFSFYEGKDILNKEQDLDTRQDGSFRYGVDYTVYDGSVIFVRQALLKIMLYRNILRDMHDAILSSPSDPFPFRQRENNSDLTNVYNDSTGFLNVRTSNIDYYSKFSMERMSVLEHLTMVVENYRDIMSLFLESTDASMHQYFRERLLSDENYLEVAIIEEMVRYMDMFIHLLYRRLSEFFPTNPLGKDIPSLAKNDFQSRGLLQYRAPFFRDEHYFDNRVRTGEDYGFGVDYVINREQDDGEHDGLARVMVQNYRDRAGLELSKYFTQLNDIQNQTNLYDSVGFELGNITERYLTPLIIRVPNRETLEQVSETQQATYPLNRYAQLFVDTFHHKSLLHPGGMNDPLILDDNPSLGQNERLYKSVVSLLQEQHEVSFEEGVDFTYPSLEVQTGQLLETTEVDDLEKTAQTIKDGPKLIPTLIGGDIDLDSATKTYITAVDRSLTSQNSINQDGYTDQKLREAKDRQRPIKLPFAIFGELSVDPEINFSLDYQEKMFNSLKMLSNKMVLSQENIASIFSDDTNEAIPASIKSMLVMASTKQVNDILNLSYDATRPVLEDQDSDTESNNISVKIFGEGNQYQSTGDPMKVYAKFMAFWMNYKQISIIEYLSGFGNLRVPFIPYPLDDNMNKLKLPIWKPLTRELLDRIEKEQTNILCRVRNYSLQEYIDALLPRKLQEDMENLNQDVFDFPVYNKYFIIGPGMIESEEGASTNKTSENECHHHTYDVDEKGNGWTSVAVHPESSDVKHRHQIINYVVQSAQSDCYPDCEVKYGVAGAKPHVHELLAETTETQSSSALQTQNIDTTSVEATQGVSSITTSRRRGGY